MDEKQFSAITRAMGQELTRRGALARLAGGLVAAAGVSRFGLRETAAASVTPVVIPGNPTCQDLGYAFEFKKDDPPAGNSTYDLKECGTTGKVIGTVTINRSANNLSFDWSSTAGIDAVLAKGGNNANLYAYNPAAFGDTNLNPPATCGGPNNPCGISHVSFCYNPRVVVTKTATTTFTRTWDWAIDKTCPADILLSPGQTFNAPYKVDVTTKSQDSDWAVSGDISISSPSCSATTITGVSDTISGGTVASVDCGVNFPYVLGAGQTLNCTYSASLPDGVDRTNTVTVTTSGAVGGGSAQAAVKFGPPTTETDECVTVTDTLGGNLGQVCGQDKTFNYSYLVDADNFNCGANTLSNTATFTTNDTGTSGSDSCNVTATVACTGGCTLTQGYWKTHSSHGPAPYDDAWAGKEDTQFFLSNQTYYEVLWTAPAGNPYYILAHQYIAAEMNVINGATMPADVKAAFDAATALLSSKTPAQVAGLKGNAKQQWTSLAGTLASFNEGKTGPGHCSEDSSSTSSFKQEAAAGGEAKKNKNKKKGGKKGKRGKKGGKGKKGKKNGSAGRNRRNRN